MNNQNLNEAIKRISNYKNNDKSGLFYMLKAINHSKYGFSYIESFTRKEILNLLISEISTEKGWNKFVEMQPYRDLKETEKETKKETLKENEINFDKLMSFRPTVYDKMTNFLGQKVLLVEHPLKGDETFVIAIFPDFKKAFYTDFFDVDDMIAEHTEYQPFLINGNFQHGI